MFIGAQNCAGKEKNKEQKKKGVSTDNRNVLYFLPPFTQQSRLYLRASLFSEVIDGLSRCELEDVHVKTGGTERYLPCIGVLQRYYEQAEQGEISNLEGKVITITTTEPSVLEHIYLITLGLDTPIIRARHSKHSSTQHPPLHRCPQVSASQSFLARSLETPQVHSQSSLNSAELDC